MPNTWYSSTPADTLNALNSDRKKGLSIREAKHRLAKFGANRLPQGHEKSGFTIFLEQFKSPLIYILLAASIVVYFLGDISDSLIIVLVLAFNAGVGAIQEGRAQRTFNALNRLTETSATVIREGKELVIPDRQVVPGDIVVLREGEKVPADCRILASTNLGVNEAALTGESLPVHKQAHWSPTNPIRRHQDTATNSTRVMISDQLTMAFKGSYVSTGSGLALVVATGNKTAIGRLAREVEKPEHEIPLQKQIHQLVRVIIITVLVASLILCIIGLLAGYPIRYLFATIIALAISSIPEGLPIVLTVVLASGLWRLSRQHALVKQLQAVETLGQTSVICVDKTGTITKNELVVSSLYIAKSDKTFSISGSSYDPEGKISFGKDISDPQKDLGLFRAVQAASLTASASVTIDNDSKVFHISGDPTEAALLIFGQKAGFTKEALLSQFSLIKELPFSFERKYHASLNSDGTRGLLLVAGAPEVILDRCGLSQAEKQRYGHVLSEITGTGTRVVAYSYRELSGASIASVDLEELPSLTFGGFYGMTDLIHPETPAVVKQIQRSGIRLIMITGDHLDTAVAIAKQVGIYKTGTQVISGVELDQLSGPELLKIIDKVSVFARVTPEHKERIVQALQSKGEVVAMTGDGVNDAPSLVAADLGIALGKNGTEVAKEAADLILVDDNLSSIVAAIEEGRGMYKTIQKVILYLFVASLGGVIVIAGALLFNLPLPLSPIQILWLNLITSGFLDVSLAMEPNEAGLFKEKPEAHKQLFTRLIVGRLVLMALVIGFVSLFVYGNYLVGVNERQASSIMLTLLAAFQWFNVWNCRHDTLSAFQNDPRRNRSLILATVGIISVQLVALYWAPLSSILNVQPLSIIEWLIVLVVASSVLWVEELRKWVVREGVGLGNWRQKLPSVTLRN